MRYVEGDVLDGSITEEAARDGFLLATTDDLTLELGETAATMFDDLSGTSGGRDGEPLVAILQDFGDRRAIDTPLDSNILLGGFRMGGSILTDTTTIEVIEFGLATGSLGRGTAGESGGGKGAGDQMRMVCSG